MVDWYWYKRGPFVVGIGNWSQLIRVYAVYPQQTKEERWQDALRGR